MTPRIDPLRRKQSCDRIGDAEPIRSAVSPLVGAPSCLAQLCASSNEELARLAAITRELDCAAIVRGADGTTHPISNSSGSGLGASSQPVVRAALHDAEGGIAGHIEMVPGAALGASELAQKLLRAVAEPMARSMNERWFRISHCRYWIVAARSAEDPNRCMMLAMDRDARLIGADHNARRILREKGIESSGLTLPRLFALAPEDLSHARHREISLKRPTVTGNDSWLVLITMPDLRAGHLGNGSRGSFHSRPRLDCLAAPGLSTGEPQPRSGFPRYMVRRIEDFVGTRLETGVDIAELAGSVGYSPSHFFRMFRRSFGTTPHTYVMKRRLAVAQELLTRTDLCLAEIALKAGFCDQSHLSRSFRHFSGLPPRAFRVHNRGPAEDQRAAGPTA